MLLAVSLLLLTVVAIPPIRMASAATGTVYYVDSEAGSNSNSGTSVNAPWKTLKHVSDRGSRFQPGDQILLKSGSIWNEAFKISFSGAEGSPITIGKYGGETKPVINGGGARYGVLMENRQHITLQDIEITNFNPLDYDDYKSAYYRRSGVWIRAFHNGPMSNISLLRLDIHDVTGISVTGATSVLNTDGEWVSKNNNAAILVNGWEWEENVPADKHAFYKNLLIEDCSIYDIRTMGINIDGKVPSFDYYHQNVVIRNNTFNKTGSDAIVVGVSNNPLVEHNSAYDVGINSVDGKWIAGMWVWKTLGATFQNNEVARVHYKNSSDTDSNAFDVDILAQGNHLFQYNYSHDNTGGFTMDMGQLKNGTTVFRYNISQNDQHNGFRGVTMNIKDPTVFYNNVFYNDNDDGFILSDNPDSTFINNIFYTSKGNAPYPAGPKFYNNNFFGSAPPVQGVNNLTYDPLFVNPGTGVDGIASVEGYKLKPNSPLIGKGRAMPVNGGKDFWGNALYTGAPDIGVFEDPASTISDTVAPNKPIELAAIDRTDTTVNLTWSASENGVPLDADIYDAADDTLLSSVIMSGNGTVTGLAPDTAYSFYVVARDLAGNESAPSDPITVKTSSAVIVDNADAVKTGNWTNQTGNTAYNGDFVTIPKGTGANTITWTPNLLQDGYYSVYYQLPDGTAGRARNASFTVNFDGGSKTYAVNETVPGGQWLPFGIHYFKAGTGGNVQLSDKADGEVAADAVKFLWEEDFSPENLTNIVLTADRLQLRLGHTMGLSVTGTDSKGKALDLMAAGLEVEFASDSAAITVSEDGVITGVSQGSANLTASVFINGQRLTSNSSEVIVGPGFIVPAPAITDVNGNALGSFTPYGVVHASTRVINSTDKQQTVTLILAVFNEKGLVKSSLKDIIIKSYEYAVLTENIIMPEDVNSAYLKVFVWDGKDGMHPLTARTIYPE
jgi:chitodextrinase